MEGKAALLHQFVGLSAWPIVLDTRDADEIVETVLHLAQGFGADPARGHRVAGVLRGRAATRRALEMPVLHDDQHGTAVAALAASPTRCGAPARLAAARVGVIGLGAAGTAIARMLGACLRARPVLGFDPGADAMARCALGRRAAKDDRDLMARADLVVAVTGRAGLIRPRVGRRGQGSSRSPIPSPRSGPRTRSPPAPRSPPTVAR